MFVNQSAPMGGGPAPAPMQQPQDDAMKRKMMVELLRSNGGGGDGYSQMGKGMGSLLGMLMAQKGGQGAMPMANGAPMQLSPQAGAPAIGPGTGGMY